MIDEKILSASLEKLIDSSSLAAVLAALSEVCREKADHIRQNWQDYSTAKPWDRASNMLMFLSGKVDV